MQEKTARSSLSRNKCDSEGIRWCNGRLREWKGMYFQHFDIDLSISLNIARYISKCNRYHFLRSMYPGYQSLIDGKLEEFQLLMPIVATALKLNCIKDGIRYFYLVHLLKNDNFSRRS